MWNSGLLTCLPPALPPRRRHRPLALAAVAGNRGALHASPAMQVRVNGQVVTEPGTQVDLRKDKVRLQEAAGGPPHDTCVLPVAPLLLRRLSS